jgi:sterol desaturase/sphingolipid hydroxylase (fatty acid hydroxylase superfamily)
MIETVELLTLLCIPAFLLLDLVLPARTPYEAARHWRPRAFLVTALSFGLALGVGTLWGSVLGAWTLFDGAALGTVGGAAVGVLVYELVHYWYHRLAHAWTPLWRAAHQMHHSAESLDAFGANYLHPLDTVFFTTWSVLVFFPLLGLAPGAGALAAAFLTFNAMFQHANVRTPRWLGYLIQRPESHHVHHARGHHRSNYADLPLWDMVFGTFENPASVEGEVGFYLGASRRVGAMLIGADVSEPVEGRVEDTVFLSPEEQAEIQAGWETQTAGSPQRAAA